MALPPTTLPLGSTTGDDQAPAPVAQLVRLLQCSRPTAPSMRHVLSQLHEVRVGRGDDSVVRRADAGARVLEIFLPDPWMSVSHARLVFALGQWVLEDLSSKNGSRLNGLKA